MLKRLNYRECKPMACYRCAHVGFHERYDEYFCTLVSKEFTPEAKVRESGVCDAFDSEFK